MLQYHPKHKMLTPLFSKIMTTVLIGNALLASPLNIPSAHAASALHDDSTAFSSTVSSYTELDTHSQGVKKREPLQSFTTAKTKEPTKAEAITQAQALIPVGVTELFNIDLKVKTSVENEAEYIEHINAESNFDVKAAIAKAYSEVGTSRPTGWSAEGECIMSVKRWLTAAGASWGPGGTPMDNYTTATEIMPEKARPGDVVQYVYSSSPTVWATGVHTVLITGINADGTYKIVESNNPGGSGLVSKNDNWKPEPPKGFTAKIFRF